MAGLADANDARTLAEWLNASCNCIHVDRAGLRAQLAERLGSTGALLDATPGLVSGSVVFLAPEHAEAMDRSVALVTRALRAAAFEARAREHAPEIARPAAAAAGGVLAFDFHLGAERPQLIEINTNPGGLLVSLELARAVRANCDCLAAPAARAAAAAIRIDVAERAVLQAFASEWSSTRGSAPLRTIAIVDDDPESQYLYPEFLLYRDAFERSGWRTVIADAASLAFAGDELLAGGEPVDLVYNRLTDFYLADEHHHALRRAYERGLAVVTPHPAAHARWADKRLLAWLRDEDLLARAGLNADERSHLLGTIPATEMVESSAGADLWRRRKNLFFKPVDGYGGKAAYRGDKLTRSNFELILARRYVAQAIAPTSLRAVGTGENDGALRVDVRNFCYDGATLLRAARLYRGQTTNFRTEGGGFAPVLQLPP